MPGSERSVAEPPASALSLATRPRAVKRRDRLDFLSRGWCRRVNELLPPGAGGPVLSLRLVETGPWAEQRHRLTGGRVALVAGGRLFRLTGPRLLADVTVGALRSRLWELFTSDDEHVLWSLYGEGRARVAGNVRRLFEELPSDTPLVPPDVRRQIRDATNAQSRGHLRSAAWKEPGA